MTLPPNDDKTRILKPKDTADVSSHSTSNSENLPEQTTNAIAADTTVFKPAGPKSPAIAVSATSEAGDKTRIMAKKPLRADEALLAGRSATSTNNANAEFSSDDKTRIASPKKMPASAQMNSQDKTRVAPKQGVNSSDATQIMPRKTAAANVSADKTQVVARKPLAQSPADKTQISAKIKPQPKKAELDATQLNPDRPALPINELSEAHTDTPGILKNRFVFEEVLGAGGMGMVYKAKDLLKVEAQDRDPYVAIKVLSDEFKSHPEAFMALQRESRKTQRIAHPNIVNVHDFDRDGDTVFMTMEYLEGKPLDKLISQYRSVGLPKDEVFKILQGICAALTYAHAQKIIHSDFKPGNIFVNNNGEAKVFDFGIARAVAKAEHIEESLDDKTVFDAGNLGALTPAYASLEMLEGHTPDVRDDIYALGCIAYELFTGKHPFNRVHADEAKRQKLKPKRIPGIPRRQWRAIERALSFERQNRSVSVDAFWREFTFQKRYAGIVIATVLLIIIGGLVAYMYFKPQEQPTYSEDDVRSEIELKLRLELKQKALDDLMANADFTPSWEENLWQTTQELVELVGASDQWLIGKKENIFSLYVGKIKSSLAEQKTESVAVWIKNAGRYSPDNALLGELSSALNGLIEKLRVAKAQQAEQDKLAEAERAKKQQTVKVEQQINTEFERALENVNTQLACRKNLDMRDLSIAVEKLKSLNLSRFNGEVPRVTSLLAQCISLIGQSFPDRAEEAKKQSIRIFGGLPVLTAITITPKDPCSPNLAGLGSRGISSGCRDKAAGNVRMPLMVVIPAKGGSSPFAIGKYEISQGEFNDFCKDSGLCTVNESLDVNLPATNLTTAQINEYLKWLSNKSNYQYRLPTKAEWLFAARGNSNKSDPNKNCVLNSRGIQKGGFLIKYSIGQQNPWGLVNVLGNAAEVVSNSGQGYVVMGGSFNTNMDECTFDHQESISAGGAETQGLRVLREIKQ